MRPATCAHRSSCASNEVVTWIRIRAACWLVSGAALDQVGWAYNGAGWCNCLIDCHSVQQRCPATQMGTCWGLTAQAKRQQRVCVTCQITQMSPSAVFRVVLVAVFTRDSPVEFQSNPVVQDICMSHSAQCTKRYTSRTWVCLRACVPSSYSTKSHGGKP